MAHLFGHYYCAELNWAASQKAAIAAHQPVLLTLLIILAKQLIVAEAIRL